MTQEQKYITQRHSEQVYGEYPTECNNLTITPLCNTILNGEEYYSDLTLNQKDNNTSIPLLVSVLILTLIFTVIFGLYFKTNLKLHQLSVSTIILLLLFLCCLGLSIQASIRIYYSKITYVNNHLIRPCYSTTKNKIIQ